jgi:acetyl esterase
MALHPYLRRLLEKSAGLPPMSSVPLARIRAGDVRRSSTGLPLAKVQGTEDHLIPGPRGELRVRLYRPPAAVSGAPLPATVFFHGSGFVICSIESHDEMCRHICAGTGGIVVSVDYALAPENPYPAAPDDCLAALRWTAGQSSRLGIDVRRIAVAGDSAGGNLATVTALRVRNEGCGPVLRAQLLLYPVTDHYTARHASYGYLPDGLSLSADDMIWFWDHYLPDRTLATRAEVSPLRAANLSGSPPTLIITARYDVLHDEGIAYAVRLREAGVPTELRSYADANHGFMFWVGAMDTATEAMDSACQWLKQRLA